MNLFSPFSRYFLCFFCTILLFLPIITASTDPTSSQVLSLDDATFDEMIAGKEVKQVYKHMHVLFFFIYVLVATKFMYFTMIICHVYMLY